MSLFRFSALAVACLLAAAPVFAEELKMTDKLHRQLIDTDPAYKAADALLERSWQLAKKRLPAATFKSLLAEQRNWVSMGRNASANELAASMPAATAFTQATLNQADEVAELVSAPVHPRVTGEYLSPDAKKPVAFKVLMNADDRAVSIRMDVGSGDELASCWYRSAPKPGRGWILMQRDENDEPSLTASTPSTGGSSDGFRILFTQGEAHIEAGTTQKLCNKALSFSGDYPQK